MFFRQILGATLVLVLVSCLPPEAGPSPTQALPPLIPAEETSEVKVHAFVTPGLKTIHPHQAASTLANDNGVQWFDMGDAFVAENYEQCAQVADEQLQAACLARLPRGVTIVVQQTLLEPAEVPYFADNSWAVRIVPRFLVEGAEIASELKDTPVMEVLCFGAPPTPEQLGEICAGPQEYCQQQYPAMIYSLGATTTKVGEAGQITLIDLNRCQNGVQLRVTFESGHQQAAFVTLETEMLQPESDANAEMQIRGNALRYSKVLSPE